MSDRDDLLREFLIESYENLDRLDRDLVALEREPGDRERLASIFRTIHTIKGTCGYFDYDKLGAVAHAGEGLLAALRDGKLRINPEITSGLLALVDAVRDMLANIERTGLEGDGDYTALVHRLTSVQGPVLASKSSAGCAPLREGSRLPARAGQGQAPPPAGAGADEEGGDAGPGAPAPGLPEGTVRVDVGLLDRLMTLVSELVLARNQVLQGTGALRNTGLLGAAQRLNRITTELQEGVMKARMQPIANVWNKFPRAVRDLALACGKQVRLGMDGEGTELDRSLIEAIKDPLTHLVRNAVDHGIESPEVRRQRGKPAEGRLSLRAYHEGGQVNIEIADDGAGIDPERVKHKALERGLLTHEQAARLGERELLQLIFLPGFSTAARVTSVSGRGVGMDVVKSNVEKIGGAVDVQSRAGQGTTVKIKIPLTLAIIPALLVTAGGDRYAIPQGNLLELVRLEDEQVRRGIEQVQGAPVYRLRGNLLPLVYLCRELGVDGERPAGAGPEVLNIAVLRADDRQFGLVVDGVTDTEEIVVKPLSQPVKGIPLFAGATILGDGRVALILDVFGLAQGAGVLTEARDRNPPCQPAAPAEPHDEQQRLLLLGLGRDRRLALPLSRVARLEQVPPASVERTADQEAVQYRGRILPLVRLASALAAGGEPAPGPGPLQVVVCAEGERSVGLVVDRILDVVEAPLEVQLSARRPGLLGSAVIQQRVTDVLDVPGLLRAADAGAPVPAAT